MKTDGLTLINGKRTARIHPQDRGLQYGDGVFRTLRATAGRLHWWADHYAKLAADAGALGITCPAEELLRSECLEAAQGADCAIRLTLTRGAGPRGYLPPADTLPTRLVHAALLPAYPASFASDGIAVRWCSLKLGHQPRLAGIKHLNRLENVLARAEWFDPEIAEGLLLDEAGWVIGGVMSNLLAVRGRTLFTPDLGQCGVAGVARMRILREAQRNGMTVRIAPLRPQDVYKAYELCLCNSLIGVWRIRTIEGKSCASNGWAEKLRIWLNEND